MPDADQSVFATDERAWSNQKFPLTCFKETMPDDQPQFSVQTIPDTDQSVFVTEERAWSNQKFPLTCYKEGEAKTCIFWDLNDYPIPRGVSPAEIFELIKDAVWKQGIDGDVLIWAYVDDDKKTLWRYYSDAGFRVEIFPEGEGGKHARDVSMYADMNLWEQNNLDIPTNVIVLATETEDAYMNLLVRTVCRCIFGGRVPVRTDSSFLTSIFDPVLRRGRGRRRRRRRR